jgi:hypothetical protein
MATVVLTNPGDFATIKQALLSGQNAVGGFSKNTTQTAGVSNANLPNVNTAQNIYGVTRKPWVFSTFANVTAATALSQQNSNEAASTIVFAANPKSVSWQMPQRGSESKNKSGSVLHIYHNRLRGTDFDDPKITIQFQAGNILPQSVDATDPNTTPENSLPGIDSNPPTNISGGLNNFYQFLTLLDQPKISNGHANTVHILYNSRTFPSLIMTGFFDPQVGVQFSDDSQNPNTITGWTATFTIYSTTPRLKSYNDLYAMFQSDSSIGFTGI